MHYYKKNIGDYHKKAGRLTMLQHGAYTLLMDACYDREKFPTLEDALDWLWASSKEEVEAVKFVLSKFFDWDDDNAAFVQQRIKEEIEKYHENAATNKRIAIERETKRREKRTKRDTTVNGDSTNLHLTKNQEPLTTNQEPVKESRAKAKRFSPPSQDQAAMYFHELLNPNAKLEAEKFVDYWESVGWMRGRTKMKCWKASARTWNKNNFGGGSNGQNKQNTGSMSAVDKVRAAIAERDSQQSADEGREISHGHDGQVVASYDRDIRP